MAIDPSTIVWDDEAPAAQPVGSMPTGQIDPATVVWDDEGDDGRPPLEIEIVGGIPESLANAGRGAVQKEVIGNPTDSMSGLDRFRAGVGKSLVDTYEGGKQFLLDSQPSAVTALAGAALGGLRGENVVQSGINSLVDVANTRRELQGETADRRQTDAALLDTGAGMSGNVLGTLAQVLGPGVLARGTAAAPALLPTTIRGNALNGLAMGAIQPSTSEADRTQNALIGLGGGAAGGVVGKAGGATYNALANFGRSGLSAADRGAAGVLLREAADPANLQRVSPSSVQGVQRTLAEETLDPGIARLERTVRSTGGQFDAIDRSNNAARVAALDSFAGDEAALKAATRARSQQTDALRDQAMKDAGVDLAPVRQMLQDQLDRSAPRPSVRSALLDVKASLDEAGDDIFSLYETRKYIGDLLSGKAGGDKAYAKAATKELMQIKGILDSKMADASPNFADYLQKYRDLSVPINRMQVGQSLTSRTSGGAVLDPVTGAQVLTPAQFSKASRSLDDVAAKATGFKKAKASEILRPGDIAIIKAVQDDLERQAFRATAGSGGNSQTFERLGVQERITRGAGREAIGMVPGGRYITGLMDVLDKTKNDQLKERLAYLVANPEEARRVLAALPAPQRATVQKTINELTGVAGRAPAPALED